MISIKTKNKEFKIAFSNKEKSQGTVDGNAFVWDVHSAKRNSFHVLMNDKSYSAELVRADVRQKTFMVKVNGNNYELQLFDQFDLLLKEMGLDQTATLKISEVRAPMPGLVLDITVSAGQVVKSGDTLLVLEAMKMENILKSPADGIVKKVLVKKRDAVEKNAVLISFE